MIRLAYAAAVAALLVSAAQAQSPAATPADPSVIPPPSGDPNTKSVTPSDGVIRPRNPDPGIAVPTSPQGNMPVIPPPGTPGGNPNIVPK